MRCCRANYDGGDVADWRRLGLRQLALIGVSKRESQKRKRRAQCVDKPPKFFFFFFFFFF